MQSPKQRRLYSPSLIRFCAQDVDEIDCGDCLNARAFDKHITAIHKAVVAWATENELLADDSDSDDDDDDNTSDSDSDDEQKSEEREAETGIKSESTRSRSSSRSRGAEFELALQTPSISLSKSEFESMINSAVSNAISKSQPQKLSSDFYSLVPLYFQ